MHRSPTSKEHHNYLNNQRQPRLSGMVKEKAFGISLGFQKITFVGCGDTGSVHLYASLKSWPNGILGLKT
jgi:hypothetical protein